MNPNQKRALKHLWKGELTIEEIAEEMGFTDEELAVAVEALQLPPRVEPDTYIPTREQILMAAAEIRAKWTPAEREARRAAARHVRLDKATENDTDACRHSSRGGGE